MLVVSNVCVFVCLSRNIEIVYLPGQEGVVAYLVALCDRGLQTGVSPLTSVSQHDQSAHPSLDRRLALGLAGEGLHASGQVP